MKHLALLLATASCLLGQSWPIPYGTGHTNQITTLPLEVQSDFSARKAGTANNAQIYAYSGNSTASNYERARIGYNGSAIGLHAEKGGSGTYRNLAFYTSATDRWYVDATSGDFWPGLNNTYAIGTASQRTTNVYTGLVNMSSGGGLDWDTRGKLRFTADGAAYLSKAAGAGNGNWSRLGFGGNTSNNPAIWLNGTNLTLAIYTDQAVPVSLTLGNIIPLGTGLLSTSIGSGASASADTTVALGEGANASAIAATALGSYSVASGPSSVAIGYNATASGDSSVAIGIGASVSRTNLIQLGGTDVDTSVGRNLYVTGNTTFTNGITTPSTTNYFGGTNRFGDTWDDLVVDGTTVRSGATAMGDGQWGTNAFLWSQYFKNNANSECFVAFELPHAWKQGQNNLNLHMHVSHPTAPSGANSNVVFQITYNWRNIGTASTNTTTVYSTNGISGAAWKSDILSLATLDGTGKTLSSIIKVGIRRLKDNGSDTYPEAIYLDSIDLHLIKDSLGSEGEVTKH